MKVDAERILLLVFFVFMLWIGIGTLWDHNLKHDFPYGYGSADAYQHQVRAEWVKEQGNYAREAPAIVAGYDDVIGYYMPGGSHLTGIFSNLSGLESYDALYFMVYLVAIMSALVMYFGVRSYNKHVALLALPLTTLIFAKTFYIGILIGQWPFTFGTLFLLGSFWALTKLNYPKSIWLIALFVSAVALTHTSELVFVVGLVGMAIILSFLQKDWRGVKTLIGAGVITGVVSIYYLIIFGLTWGKQFGYSFYVAQLNAGFPSVLAFQDFQVWILLLLSSGLAGLYFRNTILAFVIGVGFIAISKLLNLPAKLTSDFVVVSLYFVFVGLFLFVIWKRRPELAKLFSPYMILIGYSSFVGFGPRAFQTRFMWPITLAPLFGLAAYKLIMLVKSTGKIKWNVLYTMGVAIVLTAIIVGMNYDPISTPGTMYQERWDMFQWLQQNSEESATVLFFYGDGYQQTSMLYNSGRENYIVKLDDYIAGLNSQSVRREYDNSLNMDYGPGIPYRKGIVNFGYHLFEPDFPQSSRDVCRFNYYVFDKVTSQQNFAPVIQYNGFVRQTFLEHDMDEVFGNAAVSVLKNNDPGGECVA